MITKEGLQTAADALKRAMEDTENKIDQELDRLENMDDDDFERIRYARKRQLIEKQKDRELWKQMNHGSLWESGSEVDFFAACKSNPKLLIHFYKKDTNVQRSQYLDKHLAKMAEKHLDILFVKADVERHPFLVNRLKIYVIPTILFVKEMNMFHTMLGFSELNNSDDWKEADLEKLLADKGMLEEFRPTWKDTRKEIVYDEEEE